MMHRSLQMESRADVVYVQSILLFTSNEFIVLPCRRLPVASTLSYCLDVTERAGRLLVRVGRVGVHSYKYRLSVCCSKIKQFLLIFIVNLNQ